MPSGASCRAETLPCFISCRRQTQLWILLSIKPFNPCEAFCRIIFGHITSCMHQLKATGNLMLD